MAADCTGAAPNIARTAMAMTLGARLAGLRVERFRKQSATRLLQLASSLESV